MSRTGIIEVEITCKLNAEDCKTWDELTAEQQQEQEGTNPGCGGTGEFGGLCIGCHFCIDWETIGWFLVGARDG